VAKANKAKIAH